MSVGKKEPKRSKWRTHRHIGHDEVMRRANGICDGCGDKTRDLEWDHTAKRAHIVAEPYASLPELGSALCKPCHRKVTLRPHCDLDEELKWAAAERLAGDAHRLRVLEMRRDGWMAIDAIREVVRRLELEEP